MAAPVESLAVPFVKAVLLSPDRARFLLQRRAKPDDRYHGFWEIPGGRIRRGESVEACLRREVREETGLEVGELLGQTGEEWIDRFGGRVRLLRPVVTVEIAGRSRPIFGQYYAALAAGSPTPTPEGREHRWIAPDLFRTTFLAADPPEDCSPVDLLALRTAFREDRLPFFS